MIKPATTHTWYVCGRCDQPIVDEDPHTDPHTGDDVHDACCASCHPELAEVYGITLAVTTDDLRHQADLRAHNLRDDEGRPLIAGHGTLTQDQIARGEAGR